MKPYLVLFNLVSHLGWAYVFYLTVSNFLQGTLPSDFYRVVSLPLNLVQSLAFLEIIHSLVGLVRSSAVPTIMQVSSRLLLIFVTSQSPASQAHWSLYLMVASWSLVEIPRYLFYAFNLLLTQVPYPVFFLRYSLFMVLYPTGITGEVLQIWNYLPALKGVSLFAWYILLTVLVLYIPGSPYMYNHMRAQRKNALGARNTTPKPLSGIQFPISDKKSGERSTTTVNKGAFVASLAKVAPEKAKKVESERNWRFKYNRHVLDHVKACAEENAEGCVQIAKDGLDYLHNNFEFIRGDNSMSLAEAMKTFKGSFETGIIKGTKPRPESFDFVVPYHDKQLKGEEIIKQLRKWAEYGTIEPEAEEAIAMVVKNKGWLDLSDQYFVLLGAGSAMGPLIALLSLGANVVAIDINFPNVWSRLVGLARDSCGTMIFPLKKAQASIKDDNELFASAGCDLFTQTPEVANWISTVEPGKKLVVGGYAYLDGARHVQVALAMDTIMAGVCATRPGTTLAFLCTPTDAHMIPENAAKQADRNFKSLPSWQSLIHNVFGKYTGSKANVIPPIKSKQGININIVDGLVVAQGPNYALAKRMQHWRAIVARASGFAVSSNVAPSTATKSVVSNQQFAAAYKGMHHFKPMEIMFQETSNAVMAALLIHDIRNPKGIAQPHTPLSHPLALFSSGSFHGGVWRCGLTIDSIGAPSALIFYSQKYSPYIVLFFSAIGGLFFYPPHYWL